MLKIFLLTLATVCGVMATGLVFGWGFGVFDDPGWQKDALGWLGASAGSLAASCLPLVDWLDRALDGRWRQP